mmetsp:Transcript_31101/g.78070  ORF Transcript_31101/g.78070 Transcript_31101/m.78070 type:complete len:336 (-) Transcript_31101:127-1134(-)
MCCARSCRLPTCSPSTGSCCSCRRCATARRAIALTPCFEWTHCCPCWWRPHAALCRVTSPRCSDHCRCWAARRSPTRSSPSSEPTASRWPRRSALPPPAWPVSGSPLLAALSPVYANNWPAHPLPRLGLGLGLDPAPLPHLRPPSRRTLPPNATDPVHRSRIRRAQKPTTGCACPGGHWSRACALWCSLSKKNARRIKNTCQRPLLNRRSTIEPLLLRRWRQSESLRTAAHSWTRVRRFVSGASDSCSDTCRRPRCTPCINRAAAALCCPSSRPVSLHRCWCVWAKRPRCPRALRSIHRCSVCVCPYCRPRPPTVRCIELMPNSWKCCEPTSRVT